MRLFRTVQLFSFRLFSEHSNRTGCRRRSAGTFTSDLAKIVQNIPSRTDEDLNKLFPKIIKEFRPHLAGGIPEIKFPPLEPFKMEEFEFSYGNGSLLLKCLFSKIEVRHLSKFNKANFKLDTKRRLLDVDFNFPFLRLDGNYTLGGNALFMDVKGTGRFWIEVRGVRVTGTSNLKLVRNDSDANVFQSDGFKEIDVQINDLKIELVRLFNGNEVLGPFVNTVLNEYSQDFFHQAKSPLSERIGRMVMVIIDAIGYNAPFLAEGVMDKK